MRLNKSERQVQIRADEALIDEHRRARFRRAEAAMLGGVARVMIQHLEIRGNFFAHDMADFSRGRRTMQSGRDQDADAFFRNAGGLQTAQQGRQNHRIRRRAGNIADGYSRSALSCCERSERRPCNRPIQRGFDGRYGIRQSRDGRGFKNAVFVRIGKIDLEAVAAKGELRAHHPRLTSR